MQLSGKVAVVTGGAVRLGRALALALAEEGALLTIHYNSSTGPALAMVQQLRESGTEALAVQADLSEAARAGAIIDATVAHFGQVDILVNSAAVFGLGEWDDTTEAIWDRQFAINLKAPFFLSQAFATDVGRNRPGHVINIADWRGARPGTDHLAYTLAKSGLIAMTKSLAQALAPNIQVNAIAPGLILPPPGADPARLEDIARGIPARRVGSPQEVARAMLYLLESDFVTGDLVFVTGGQHL